MPVDHINGRRPLPAYLNGGYQLTGSPQETCNGTLDDANKPNDQGWKVFSPTKDANSHVSGAAPAKQADQYDVVITDVGKTAALRKSAPSEMSTYSFTVSNSEPSSTQCVPRNVSDPSAVNGGVNTGALHAGPLMIGSPSTPHYVDSTYRTSDGFTVYVPNTSGNADQASLSPSSAYSSMPRQATLPIHHDNQQFSATTNTQPVTSVYPSVPETSGQSPYSTVLPRQHEDVESNVSNINVSG